MSKLKVGKKVRSARGGAKATLQWSRLFIVESPLSISVLGHENVVALPVYNLCLHEVVQDHGSCVVWNVSDLLLLLSKLGLHFIKSGQFGADHVLLLELQLLGVDDLGLGPSTLRASLEHVDSRAMQDYTEKRG